MGDQTEDMAGMTRKLARDDDAGNQPAPGPRDTGSGDAPEDDHPLGQQGIGQSDDIHAQSSDLGMAQQQANPSEQRGADRPDDARDRDETGEFVEQSADEQSDG